MIGRLLVGALLLASGALVCLEGCNRPQQGETVKVSANTTLPTIKAAPHFEGMDAWGQHFNSDKLKGNVWLASFMFTSCQGVCPVMNGNLRDFQLGLAGTNVKFVSLTVDPTTDTPEILQHYAEQYNAEKDRWFFVRMSLDSVRELSVKGFLLSDPVEPSAHSPRYVLVDQTNNIRGYYDSMDSLKVVQLKTDIAQLLKDGVH